MRNAFLKHVYGNKSRSGGSVSYRSNAVDQRNLNTITQGTLKLEGFIKEGEGKFQKSKGHQYIKTIGSDIITLIEPFFGDWWVVAYGTTVALYYSDTGTVTTVKTDFTTSDPYTGGAYVEKFYLCNGGDKIGYVQMKLSYDAQTADFTKGRTLTGATSGATALIYDDSDGGATGTLTLYNVQGEFIDNETITDDAGGSATANGALTGAYTALTNAPKAKIVRVGAERLYAGNITDDGTGAPKPNETWVSASDSGSGIPDSWTEAVNIGNPYRIRRGGIGEVKDVIINNEVVFVIYEQGRGASKLVFEADGSGGVDQRLEDVFFNTDFGGQQGAISTKHGIFYGTQNGVYLMRGGSGNVVDESNIMEGYSEAERAKYDFSDCDMVYLPVSELLIVTCRKNSGSNNATLLYDIRDGVLSERTGWTFKRISKDYTGNTLLATDSYTGKIAEYLSGYDDDGKDVFCKWEKDFDFGDIKQVKSMQELTINGKLGTNSLVRIEIDVWDEDHNITQNKFVYEWTLDTNGMAGQNGYNEMGYNATAYNGQTIQEATGHFNACYIPRFTKIRVRVKESSMLPFDFHEIAFGEIKGVRPIMKNNLTPV